MSVYIKWVELIILGQIYGSPGISFSKCVGLRNYYSFMCSVVRSILQLTSADAYLPYMSAFSLASGGLHFIVYELQKLS